MILSARRKGRIRSVGDLRAWLGRAAAALLALLAGGVNASFGGGGGVLTVPALEKCLGEEERRAHATSVAVTLPLSLVSALIYTMRGTWDPLLAVTVGVGATVGGVIGGLLLKKVPKDGLSILFYALMIYVGIKYLE